MQELGWVALSLIVAVFPTTVLCIPLFLVLFPARAFGIGEWLTLAGLWLACAMLVAVLLRWVRNRQVWWSITVADNVIRLARNTCELEIPLDDLELVQVPFDDRSQSGFRVWPIVLHVSGGKKYRVPLSSDDISACFHELEQRCPLAGMIWGDKEIAPRQRQVLSERLEQMGGVRRTSAWVMLVLSAAGILYGLIVVILLVFGAVNQRFWPHAFHILALPAGIIGLTRAVRMLNRSRLLAEAARRTHANASED